MTDQRAVVDFIPVHPNMTDDEWREVIRRLEIPQAAIDRLVKAVLRAAMEADERDGAA